MKKLSNFVHEKKASIAKILTLAMCFCLCLCLAVPCMATDGTTEETASLNINFDVAEMFTWAEMMINAMKPVMYITMGVGLAFLILNAFKAIFRH